MADTFDQFLFEHQSGDLNREITEQMHALTKALQARASESGEATGEISLKLSFKALNNGRVEICAEAKIKAPGPHKTKEIRWLDKNGRLAAEDPRQTVLPMSTRKKDPSFVTGESRGL